MNNSRQPPALLKALLFLVSVLPVFLLMKSLLFKRGAGAEAAVCNFRRQVGYLAIGIGAVLGAVMVYRLMMSWFM